MTQTASVRPSPSTRRFFVSKDGGTTWTPGAVVPITSSTPFGAFLLGPSQFMRNLEFPTLASFKGNVYMAWNDGGDGSGHSHIRLAQLDSSRPGHQELVHHLGIK